MAGDVGGAVPVVGRVLGEDDGVGGEEEEDQAGVGLGDGGGGDEVGFGFEGAVAEGGGEDAGGWGCVSWGFCGGGGDGGWGMGGCVPDAVIFYAVGVLELLGLPDCVVGVLVCVVARDFAGCHAAEMVSGVRSV